VHQIGTTENWAVDRVMDRDINAAYNIALYHQYRFTAWVMRLLKNRWLLGASQVRRDARKKIIRRFWVTFNALLSVRKYLAGTTNSPGSYHLLRQLSESDRKTLIKELNDAFVILLGQPRTAPFPSLSREQWIAGCSALWELMPKWITRLSSDPSDLQVTSIFDFDVHFSNTALNQIKSIAADSPFSPLGSLQKNLRWMPKCICAG